ncbi:MAG: phage tail tube protein [Gemmatimonadota bacterium]
MTFAQGARNQLAIRLQPDFLTQATGNYQAIPITGHTLDLSKGALESQTLRSDREVQDFRHGARSVAGSINTEFRYGAYDDLIQSAMFAPWASSEIGIGTNPFFFSAEDGQLDINQFRMFNGILVSRMGISIQANSMVTATFDVVGRQMTQSGTTGAGSVVAASTNQPFDSFSGAVFDQFPSSGAEVATITGIDFQVDNGVSPTFVVGDSIAPALQYGRGRVTGNMTVYYRDATFVNRFLNETEFAMYVTVVDPAGNDIAFTFPRVKLGGAAVPVNNEQARILTAPFVALKPTSGTITTALRIQR